MNQLSKMAVRLKVKELMVAQIEKGIPNDTELAKCIGVSTTQIWRAKLPPTDERHNAPGNQFIAGVLSTFEGPFEKYFNVDCISADKNEVSPYEC